MSYINYIAYFILYQDEESESGREGLEAVVERRRVRKAWEERRHTLMFNYTQFSYYGKPVSKKKNSFT